MIKQIKPQQKILLAYIALILVGSILLFLPFSTNSEVSYLNMLFTSVSAVTITGLDPIEITSTLTVFGKVIVALLIQIGGLSIITIQVFLLTLIGAKIRYKDRDLTKENIGVNHRDGIIKTIKRIVTISLAIELIGIIMFLPFFMDQGFSFSRAFGHAVFHTISAYNNAGFSILGADSLSIYSENLYFNIITITLIVLGGIGTLVIYDIAKNRRWKKINFHSRIVLMMTVMMFVSSSLLFFALENDASIINSLFHSATIRTAGFYTYNYVNAKTVTLLMMMIFMFIGGAPASTAGGIKVTTVFTLYRATKAKLMNNTPTYKKRKIPSDYVNKAYLILIFSIVTTILATIIILIVENESLIKVFFEVFSAYSNTGLSLGLTVTLHTLSKIVLMIVMLVGRVGIITFVEALIFTEKQYENISYIDLEYLI